MKKFIRDTNGASAAEFALVVMPMVIIFTVIIQFGFILYTQNNMQNAAREAARRMAVDETTTFTDGDNVLCSSSPSAGTVANVACNAMAGWTGEFTVVTDATVIGATDFAEMTVSISTDMGSVGIFDILGVAAGRNLSAAATHKSEFEYPPS